MGKASWLDGIFIRKHSADIYLSLYETLELPSNTVENVLAVYTTIALICIELATEESVMDLLRLIISIQVKNWSYFEITRETCFFLIRCPSSRTWR